MESAYEESVILYSQTYQITMKYMLSPVLT